LEENDLEFRHTAEDIIKNIITLYVNLKKISWKIKILPMLSNTLKWFFLANWKATHFNT